MEYLSAHERQAISNLYGVAEKLVSDYPIELALVYNQILGEEINPSELSVSQNAALLFECLYLEEGSYSETFNLLNESIADDSANDSSTRIYGCINPQAQNFNPEATVNDGSCMYDGSRAIRSCDCSIELPCTVMGTTNPCYGACCDSTVYPSPDPDDYDDWWCGDPNATNYNESGSCEYGNSSGIGLLNALTAIGNAIWGVVEEIGVGVIYDDIVNNDQNTLNNNTNQGCPAGQVYCKSNGIAGCNAAINCDTTEKEKSYTWLYVTLGILAVGGIGYLIYKKNK